MTHSILALVRKELRKNADESVKRSAQNFFKEKVLHYGVKTPLVKKISKKYYADIKTMSKSEVFEICESLFASGYCEEAFIACHWSNNVYQEYVSTDFKVFERWVQLYVTNWAVCDTLCNHTVGDFLMIYPEYVQKLKGWAVSKNRWVKRASVVSLILPARHGHYLKDVFELADILLLDTDDLVQKGYGWLLKEASKAHLNEVFEYVMQHKAVMPRTALRYAIEKMPEALRKKAMQR